MPQERKRKRPWNRFILFMNWIEQLITHFIIQCSHTHLMTPHHNRTSQEGPLLPCCWNNKSNHPNNSGTMSSPFSPYLYFGVAKAPSKCLNCSKKKNKKLVPLTLASSNERGLQSHQWKKPPGSGPTPRRRQLTTLPCLLFTQRCEEFVY